MELIVCVKQVPDPEAPAGSFKIDPTANQVVASPDVANVLSTFDEVAVEAALRVRETYGGTVTALSLGNNLARDVVKKPLGMGADRLILLEGEAYEGGDSWSTARALAAAIRKIGDFDLIFCGRQAADWDAGQVGLGIAELLGIPSVSLVKKIEVEGDQVQVERVVADGFEVVEAPLPCLVTLTNEFGEPRYASLKGIMRAEKIQPIVWQPEDLGIDPAEIGGRGRRSKLVRLFQPVKEGHCEIVEGESDAEAAVHLALRLREAKIL